MSADYSIYFSGQKLYGDDFDDNQIKEWHDDEKEGYSGLGASDNDTYEYEYHGWNIHNGFKYINEQKIASALGLGSAYGDEFIPILDKIDKITIIEPSAKLKNNDYEYVEPTIKGDMPFESANFNLILCFGVLHHIPNVTYVLNECYRCLDYEGYMLLREPIVSMGDWRKNRNGLTKRERGIPVKLLDKIITDSGFSIIKKTLCDFRPSTIIFSKMGIKPFNSSLLVFIDKCLSYIFSWNITYHRNNTISKFAPASAYYVLKKEKR